MFGPVDRLEPDEASNDGILEVGVLDGVRVGVTFEYLHRAECS